MENIIFEHSQAKNFLLVFNCDLIFTSSSDSIYFLDNLVYSNTPEKVIRVNGKSEGWFYRQSDLGFSLGLYRNGLNDGTTKFYENGMLRKIIIWSNGETINYSRMGNIVNRMTKNHFTSYFLNGETEIERIVEGNNEIYKEYYPGGVLKVLINFRFDGNNSIIHYYPTGIKESETNYKNGLLDGLKIEYYENGVIHIESNYHRDELNGLRAWYHSNGKIQYLENYVNNKLDGTIIIYDLEGQPLYETVFAEGVRIK